MSEHDPTALHRMLTEHGHALIRVPGLREQAQSDPWGAARRLWGEDVALVEAHPIHPVPHGRSYASNQGYTPLHSDSQMACGVPPRVQVMLCVRPAAEGGETLLLDTWALLERIAAEEPELFHALLTWPRRIPFVFGDVFDPTVSLRGGNVVFTHSPMPANDELGGRLAPWIERAPLVELRVEADEVLVVDNHRMLHGRRGFVDPERRFLRLLLWTRTPGQAPEWLRNAVTAVQSAFASAVSPPSEAQRRLAIVLEHLRGVSPGILARRHGVPEPELYRWRDVALRAAQSALEELPSAVDYHEAAEQLRRALDRKLC
jgi:gamma-butyrobetaine dioxygenase